MFRIAIIGTETVDYLNPPITAGQRIRLGQPKLLTDKNNKEIRLGDIAPLAHPFIDEQEQADLERVVTGAEIRSAFVSPKQYGLAARIGLHGRVRLPFESMLQHLPKGQAPYGPIGRIRAKRLIGGDTFQGRAWLNDERHLNGHPDSSIDVNLDPEGNVVEHDHSYWAATYQHNIALLAKQVMTAINHLYTHHHRREAPDVVIPFSAKEHIWFATGAKHQMIEGTHFVTLAKDEETAQRHWREPMHLYRRERDGR